jgi:hypothetical protein
MRALLHVTSVRHLGGHRLAVAFSDGSEREVDLKEALHGEVFEPLRDETFFAQAYVDAETRTVAWPNGADLAPEYLHEVGRELERAG